MSCRRANLRKSMSCLSIGEATLERLLEEILIPTNQRGNRNPPLKANLSALSFRPHKKGRARRGMSDKVKTISNIIGVIICYLHSLQPLRLFTTQKSTSPYTGEAWVVQIFEPRQREARYSLSILKE